MPQQVGKAILLLSFQDLVDMLKLSNEYMVTDAQVDFRTQSIELMLVGPNLLLTGRCEHVRRISLDEIGEL